MKYFSFIFSSELRSTGLGSLCVRSSRRSFFSSVLYPLSSSCRCSFFFLSFSFIYFPWRNGQHSALSIYPFILILMWDVRNVFVLCKLHFYIIICIVLLAASTYTHHQAYTYTHWCQTVYCTVVFICSKHAVAVCCDCAVQRILFMWFTRK